MKCLTGVPGRSARACTARNHSDLQANRRQNKRLAASTDAENPAEEIGRNSCCCGCWCCGCSTLCCYGAQVLLERQRLAIRGGGANSPRARASCIPPAGWPPSSRTRSKIRWRSSTTPPIRCGVRCAKANAAAAQQIEIIQEEVARADQVITQVMGYAQLSEGRVEKLDVVEEIEQRHRAGFSRRRADGNQVGQKNSPGRFRRC